MRIKYIIIASFLLPFMASAEVAVGVDLRTNLINNTESQTGGNSRIDVSNTNFSFTLIPSIIIRPNRSFEIVPNVGFSINHTKNEHRTNDSLTDESSGTGFEGGPGCGLFFRLIDASVFRFSIGPDVQFWYSNPYGDNNWVFNASIGLPANIDLKLSERFFARISDRLFSAGYTYNKINADDHISGVTFFDIRTILMPSFGFYFSF
jgi:hypothetical protein